MTAWGTVVHRVVNRRAQSAMRAMLLLAALAAGVELRAQSAPTKAGAAPSALTLALLDVPVADALEALSQAASINLVWQAKSLGAAAAMRISCRVTKGEPETMLRCITRAAGLDFYRLSTGTYVVIAAAEMPPGYATLGGTVVDAESGAPVPAARLTLAEVDGDARANDDGAFRFARLRPGRYALTARALGYQPAVTTLDLDANGLQRLRLRLTPTAVRQRPVIVQGIRVGEVSGSLGASDVSRTQEATILGPGLWVPGAVAPLGVARRDGTGDLHVQGGDIGEHPWRLDGIPMYDVSTLTGLVGLVSPLAVDRVQVRRAGFRAREGSFTAGVIDLSHALDGTPGGGATAEAAFDPLSATVRVSAPLTLAGAEGRAMLAARTGLWSFTAPAAMVRAVRHWSVPDPVLLARVSGFAAVPGMSELDRTPYATSLGDPAVRVLDVHGATRLAWGAAHELSLSGFTASSGLAYAGLALDRGDATLATRDDYAWRTIGAQASHTWLLGTRVRQTVQLRASRHTLEHATAMTMTRTLPVGIAGGESNAIAEVTLGSQWSIAAAARVDLTLGVEGSRTTARLDLANRVLRPLALNQGVWRGALYADATTQLTPALFVDAGLRVTQLATGQTFAEPRLAVRGESRSPGTPWSWRLSGGGYHQFVSQYDVATTMPVAFVPSMRFWLPADGATPVAQAWHVASEAVWRPAARWELRADAYLRWQPRLPLIDYGVMYDAANSGVPVGADVIRSMSGAAQGMGVRAIHDARWQRYTWRTELAYDAGWATRRYPSRFGESLQPPPWLEPHRLLLATELSGTHGFRLGARARGILQRPWALRQAYYDLFGAAPGSSGLPLDMPGDMLRPMLLEVDVGAGWTRRVAGVQTDVAFQLSNALGRANVLDFGLRRRERGDGYDMVPRFLPGRQPALTVQLSR